MEKAVFTAVEGFLKAFDKYSRSLEKLVSLIFLSAFAVTILYAIVSDKTSTVLNVGNKIGAAVKSEFVPVFIFGAIGTLVGLAATFTLFPSRLDRERERMASAAEREALRSIARIRRDAIPAAAAGDKVAVRRDAQQVNPESAGVAYVATIFAKNRKTLSSELNRVEKASRQALYFGIFFSVIAIGIAASVAFLAISSEKGNLHVSGIFDFLQFYLPKLSMIILPEIIALFFLNLYVINQRDVRAIHNEITNVDLKEAGVAILFSRGREDEFIGVVKELVKTERNFIVRRGERILNEADQFEKMTDHLKGLEGVLRSLKKD